MVLGGKTYLSGKVKVLKPESPTARLTWSKASGPGGVNFANASAAETTATFSAPGDYVLKLTAGEGQLSSSSTLNARVVPHPNHTITLATCSDTSRL